MSDKGTLEDRITTRLHEQIGDLITDDDLKAMVARGIERALFEPRFSEQQSSYGNTVNKKASIVDELVAKLLGEKMKAAVDDYLWTHPELLQTAIDKAIASGASHAIMSTLDDKFANIFHIAVSNMKSQGLLPRGPQG